MLQRVGKLLSKMSTCFPGHSSHSLASLSFSRAAPYRYREEPGDGKHRLYTGASTRLARGCPLCSAEAPRERPGIRKLAFRMPHCRGDACHRLACSDVAHFQEARAESVDLSFDIFAANGVVEQLGHF